MTIKTFMHRIATLEKTIFPNRFLKIYSHIALSQKEGSDVFTVES